MGVSVSANPAIGTIVAAFIGGGISFIVTVLTKEQKTSEFRQAWIDGLRNDLSDFMSTVDTLCSFIRLKKSESSSAILSFLEERSLDVHRMGVSYNRILLGLNPKEHGELERRLKKLLSVMASYKTATDANHVDNLVNDVIEESRKVLKEEWKRVKRGEIVYRFTKYTSLTVFVAAVTLGVAVSFGLWGW